MYFQKNGWCYTESNIILWKDFNFNNKSKKYDCLIGKEKSVLKNLDDTEWINHEIQLPKDKKALKCCSVDISVLYDCIDIIKSQFISQILKLIIIQCGKIVATDNYRMIIKKTNIPNNIYFELNTILLLKKFKAKIVTLSVLENKDLLIKWDSYCLIQGNKDLDKNFPFWNTIEAKVNGLEETNGYMMINSDKLLEITKNVRKIFKDDEVKCDNIKFVTDAKNRTLNISMENVDVKVQKTLQYIPSKLETNNKSILLNSKFLSHGLKQFKKNVSLYIDTNMNICKISNTDIEYLIMAIEESE